MRLTIAGMALAAGLLAGCSDDLTISVQEKWTEGIRNYGLTAVYPMREDIYIGTVRLVLNEDKPFGINSRNYGYIDLRHVLNSAYDELPNYPTLDQGTRATIANNVNGDVVAVWDQPPGPAGGSQGGAGSNRPRLATLPGVSLVRLTAADLQRPGLLSAITGAFRDEANLDISLGEIESVELDDVTALRVFGSSLQQRLVRDPVFRNSICVSFRSLGGERFEDLSIEMVTRVFYARSINYSYGDSLSAGLNAATTPPADPSSIIAQPTPEGQQPPPAAPGNAAAEVGQQGPVTGTISGVTNDALERDEVFERPMAFGATTIGFSVEGLGLTCENGAARIVEGGQLEGWFRRACGGIPLSTCQLGTMNDWPSSGGQPVLPDPRIGAATIADPLTSQGPLSSPGSSDS